MYGRAAFACVLKLVLGILAEYWIAPTWPGSTSRFIGFAIDFAWLVVLLWTLVLSRKLARERRNLGIVLNALVVSESEQTDQDKAREEP